MIDSKQVGPAEKRRPPNAGMGRKVGSMNKTTAAVKEALLMAFDDIGGVEALATWAAANQDKFYPIWAKLLPQEIKGELEISNVTPEERNSRVAALLEAARARRDRDVGDATA